MDSGKAFCKHFGTCGGCASQDVAYNEQVLLKENALRAAISASGFQGQIVRPMIISPKITGYRNRMDFVAFSLLDGKPGMGLRQKGSRGKTIDVETCHLMPPWQDKARLAVKKWQEEFAVSSYDQKGHSGILRYVICRDANSGTERMVNLVVSSKVPHQEELKKSLQTIGVTCAYFLMNSGLADVSTGEPRHFFGKKGLTEEINGVRYSYGPLCFFQPNPYLAPEMARVVREAVRSTAAVKVLDLYCGVGLFALAVAKDAPTVKGVELVGESIEFAKENGISNKAENVEFFASPAETMASRQFLSGFDTVIADPPRSGLHPKVISALALATSVKTLIYSSCNPSKLVQDAMQLSGAFELEWVQPIDMFPHTPHFEAIGLFRRK